jgi:hypothetical protein
VEHHESVEGEQALGVEAAGVEDALDQELGMVAAERAQAQLFQGKRSAPRAENAALLAPS